METLKQNKPEKVEKITEISPETKNEMIKQIEEKLEKLKIPEKSIDEYFKKISPRDVFVGNEKQIKLVFSSILKEEMIQENKTELENTKVGIINIKSDEYSRLNVRDKNGALVGSISEGKQVEILGEEDGKVKISFLNNSGKKVEGFVLSQNILGVEKTDKKFENFVDEKILDKLLIELGYKADFDTKRILFKNISNFGSYNGNNEQIKALFLFLSNGKPYEKFVLNNQTKEQLSTLKGEVENNNKQEKKQEEKPKKDKEKKGFGENFNVDKFKEQKINNINSGFEKCLNNPKIKEYLENNLDNILDEKISQEKNKKNKINLTNIKEKLSKTTDLKERLEIFAKVTFGKLEMNSITDFSKVYAYLFIKSHNIPGIIDYIKMKQTPEEKLNDPDGQKKKKELTEKYSKNKDFLAPNGSSSNTNILYNYVVEKELGENYLDMIKTEIELDSLAIDTQKIKSASYEHSGTSTMCSRTSAKTLRRVGVPEGEILRGDAIKLYKDINPKVAVNGLEGSIKNTLLTSGKNIIDIYPNTRNGHRAIAFMGEDCKVYVLDPYYAGLRNTKPKEIGTRLDALDGKCNKVAIGPSYRVKQNEKGKFSYVA